MSPPQGDRADDDAEAVISRLREAGILAVPWLPDLASFLMTARGRAALLALREALDRERAGLGEASTAARRFADLFNEYLWYRRTLAPTTATLVRRVYTGCVTCAVLVLWMDGLRTSAHPLGGALWSVAALWAWKSLVTQG
jgi:hypothetical protein